MDEKEKEDQKPSFIYEGLTMIGMVSMLIALVFLLGKLFAWLWSVV